MPPSRLDKGHYSGAYNVVGAPEVLSERLCKYSNGSTATACERDGWLCAELKNAVESHERLERLLGRQSAVISWHGADDVIVSVTCPQTPTAPNLESQRQGSPNHLTTPQAPAVVNESLRRCHLPRTTMRCVQECP